VCIAAYSFAVHLEPLDLTPQHVGILRLLALKPTNLTQTELASRLGVLPSRLVVLLDEIAQRGLLKREPNPGDRRSNVLRMTPAGARAFDAVEEVTAKLDEEMFAGLSVARCKALTGILRDLVDQLGLGVNPSSGNQKDGQ
jgi:DNA-binding MarR family transcriptional regulator